MSYFKYELPTTKNRSAICRKIQYHFSRENSYLLVLRLKSVPFRVVAEEIIYNIMGGVIFNISKVLLKISFMVLLLVKSLFTLLHKRIFTWDQMVIIVSNVTIIMKSAVTEQAFLMCQSMCKVFLFALFSSIPKRRQKASIITHVFHIANLRFQEAGWPPKVKPAVNGMARKSTNLQDLCS